MQEPIQSYEISSPEGMKVEVLNLGAGIRSIWVPHGDGLINVALGYEDIEHYKSDAFYMGATVGRFANRIANGQFSLGKHSFQLPANDGENHLHGGPDGFSKRHWGLVEHNTDSLTLELFSKDGDQGYLGNLSVQALFKLEAGMRLVIEYRATTDKATPVNISSHVYFNLNGYINQSAGNRASVANHLVMLHASFFTPVGSNMIPSGQILPVADSPFDFRDRAILGERLATSDAQIRKAHGFDHNFIVDGVQPEQRLFAAVQSPLSGLCMNVYSNQPGVQFYTGNFLNAPFQAYEGLCLETQNFPDALNHDAFPNSVLEPGKAYLSESLFAFTGC